MEIQQSILILGVNFLLFVFVWHFAFLPLRKKILRNKLNLMGLKLLDLAKSKGIKEDNEALLNTLSLIKSYDENIDQYSFSWFISFRRQLIKNKVDVKLISTEMEKFFKSGNLRFDNDIKKVRRQCAEDIIIFTFTSSICSFSLFSVLFIVCALIDVSKAIIEKSKKSCMQKIFANEYKITEIADSNKFAFVS